MKKYEYVIASWSTKQPYPEKEINRYAEKWYRVVSNVFEEKTENWQLFSVVMEREVEKKKEIPLDEWINQNE